MKIFPIYFPVYSFLIHQVLTTTITPAENVLGCRELLLYIGNYLAIPQMNLGYVNKGFHEILFDRFKLKNLIIDLCSSPELLTYNDEDSMFFEELKTISDEFYLFDAIAAGLFTQNAFKPYSKLVSRLLLKKYQTARVSEIVRQKFYKSNGLIDKFSTFLLSIEDFESIFELLKSSPKIFCKFYEDLDSTMKDLFIERLMKYENGKNIYRNFINYFYYEGTRAKFIALSILNFVPEELFIQKLSSSQNLMKKTFKFLFFQTFQLKNKNPLMFFNIKRVLKHVKEEIYWLSEFKEFEFYNLINMIRFGSKIEEEEAIEIIRTREFDNLELLKIYFCSVVSEKQEISQNIRKDPKFINLKASDSVYKYLFGCYQSQIFFFLNNFDQLSIDEKRNLYSQLGFFNLISLHYEARGVYQNNFMLKIDFEIKNKFRTDSLPNNFTYFYRFLTDDIEINTMIEFEQLVDINSDELLTLIESIRNCPIFTEEIEQTNFKTTFEVIHIISKSQELQNAVRNSGIRFLIESANLAKLLNEPLELMNMNSIINFTEYHLLLPYLVTRNQLKNLEIFTGEPIYTIFLELVVPQLRIINESTYFEYRVALKYWLNGHYKEHLLDLTITLFRKLLAIEVSEKDSAFLTSDSIYLNQS